MFAGKHGYITPRDLFKWAGRGAVGYQQLAESGYLLLAERLRSAPERAIVQEVLESVMRVKVLLLLQRECGMLPEHLQRSCSEQQHWRSPAGCACRCVCVSLHGLPKVYAAVRLYSGCRVRHVCLGQLVDRCLSVGPMCQAR